VNREEFDRVSLAHKKLKKEVYYGLDTNLFYHGFPSRSGIDPTHFALLDITRQEIENSLNIKYSPQQISLIKRNARYQKQMLDEMVNQRTHRARLAAYLALRQYLMVRDRGLEIRVREPFNQDSEKNDLIIVRAIRQFEVERYPLPILLTADRNMATLCEAEGVEYFLFQVPYTFSEEHCTPFQMVRFLFNLAAVFGFIQCGSIYLFGEFRGKGPVLEELKLVFQNQKIEEAFIKDFEICRKLIKLPIST
jgi:hypothetical protein